MNRKEKICPICPLKLYNTVKDKVNKHISPSLTKKFFVLKNDLQKELERELKKNGLTRTDLSKKFSTKLNKLETFAHDYSNMAANILEDLAQHLRVNVGAKKSTKTKKAHKI